MLGTAQNKALWEEVGQEPNAYTPIVLPHPLLLGLPVTNLHGSVLQNIYPYLKVTFQGEVGSLHAWILGFL